MLATHDTCTALDINYDLTKCLKIIKPFIKKFKDREAFFRNTLVRNNEYIVNEDLQLQGTSLDKHRHLKDYNGSKYKHTNNDLLLQFLKPEFGISIHGPYFDEFMPKEYYNLISMLKNKGLLLSIEYPCFAITFNRIRKHHDLRQGCALNIVLEQGNTFLRIYKDNGDFTDFHNSKCILFDPEQKHEVLNNSSTISQRISLTISFNEKYNFVKQQLKEYII